MTDTLIQELHAIRHEAMGSEFNMGFNTCLKMMYAILNRHEQRGEIPDNELDALIRYEICNNGDANTGEGVDSIVDGINKALRPFLKREQREIRDNSKGIHALKAGVIGHLQRDEEVNRQWLIETVSCIAHMGLYNASKREQRETQLPSDGEMLVEMINLYNEAQMPPCPYEEDAVRMKEVLDYIKPYLKRESVALELEYARGLMWRMWNNEAGDSEIDGYLNERKITKIEGEKS